MHCLLVILFFLVGGLAAGKAHASELEISPVLLTLAAGQSSTTIEVSNRGTSPVTLQARPFLWTQLQTDDVLDPTSDLILSPPIFTVPAGATQTVRLLLRSGAQARSGSERSYRLLLDEVTTSPVREGQVAVVLRMSVPLFVVSADTAPRLAWTASRSPDGDVVLTAVNTGGAWVRIIGLEATLGDGRRSQVTARSKSPYVLAGAQRQWVVEGPVAPGGPPLRLRVDTQMGVTDVVLSP